MNVNLSHVSDSDLRQIDIVKIYTNKKCLIVDDFPEIRGSLSRTLKTFGAHSVDTAANGEEAIKLCSKKKYDIVICDYNLGAGKDGQQILEEVRFLRVLLMTSLFVMITGESSREMVLGALECQPDDYVTKPYTQASLKARLDKAIVRHEALLPIKRKISEGDYRVALDLCNEQIDGGSRYAGDCLKMKAQLHILLEQFNDAASVYESVLSNRPLVWAKLGMCKAQKARGKLDEAEALCREIIDEDDRYIEAHDLLAEIFNQRKDTISAQSAVENGTRISPKSVLRHRKLAQIAERNNDDDVALKSYQHAIKWGANSCHESEQDYFNYARKVSDVVKGDDTTEAKLLVKQAGTFLDRARKRYANRPDVAAQAQLVDCQLLVSRGQESKAKESLEKAKQLIKDIPAPPVETSLELARAHHALHEEDEARNLLITLAARHGKDSALMQIIDSITGEPISDAGKEIAARLTKNGISSYDQKAYNDSISVFNEALATYPKHIGLHLNLVQAICASAEQHGYSEKEAAMCRRSIKTIGQLPPDHKQYKRYQFLHKQLKKYYPDAVV